MKQHLPILAAILIAGVALISFALSKSNEFAVAGFFGPFPIGAGNGLNLIKLSIILIGIAIVAITIVAILVPRLRRK